MSEPNPTAPSVTARTDPSVTLLSTIVDTALDPGYAQAASRHTSQPSAPSRRRAIGWGAVVVLAVAGLGLGIAVKDVRTTSLPEARQAREALAVRVDDQLAVNDATEARLAVLEAEVAALTDATAGGPSDRSLRREVQAATIAVTGPGVVVTVDDADHRPADGENDDPSLSTVLDRDLQIVANGLWSAGAEAITINGQRLTATSAIRSAGGAILVDYRPLTRPYVVMAVGPADMRQTFVDGTAGLALRTLSESYGLRFSVEGADDLDLNAGSDSPLRYAQPGPMKGEQSE